MSPQRMAGVPRPQRRESEAELRGRAGPAAGTAPCAMRPLGLLWEPSECHCRFSVTPRARAKSLLGEARERRRVHRGAFMPAPPSPAAPGVARQSRRAFMGSAKHRGKGKSLQIPPSPSPPPLPPGFSPLFFLFFFFF